MQSKVARHAGGAWQRRQSAWPHLREAVRHAGVPLRPALPAELLVHVAAKLAPGGGYKGGGGEDEEGAPV